MALILYPSNDNLVTWDAMTRASDGAYVNDATVTMTLKTAAGVAVSGAENVSLPYVAASNGKYQGAIESTVALITDASYRLEVTAVSGARNGFVSLDCVTRTRTA